MQSDKAVDATVLNQDKPFNDQFLLKQFLNVAGPTVMMGWLAAIFFVVDGIFIGRFIGPDALAASNLALPILVLPFAFGIMISVGGSTRCAVLLGQGKFLEAAAIFTQATWLVMIGGSLIGLMFYFMADSIAYVLGARDHIHTMAANYLRYYSFFQPFVIIAFTFEAFLRLENAARVGMYAMGAAALANIGLDYFLIVTCGLGMKGSALATGITLSLSGLAMLMYHVLRANHLKLIRRAFSRFKQEITTILYLGLSEFLSQIAPMAVIASFNFAVLNWIGKDGLVAYTILDQTIMIGTITLIALMQSMQSMVSYFFGAEKRVEMMRCVAIGCSFIIGFSLLLALMVVFAAKPLTVIYLGKNIQEIWHHLEFATKWYGLALIPGGINLVVLGYLTAIQAPTKSTIIALLRSWIILLIALWTLPAFFGAQAIWLVILITELATLPVSLILLRFTKIKWSSTAQLA